jgi:small-conductance mechanosensitive channel
LHRYIPKQAAYFVDCANNNPRWRLTTLLCAVGLSFLSHWFISIYFWVVLFLFLKFELIVNLGVLLVFYLGSIPYLCYLACSLARYCILFNEKYDFGIISKSFQDRFFLIFQFLSCSSLTILFLREAFLSITIGSSEFPAILQALAWINLEISLVLLIGKEEVLSLMPTRNRVWSWIATFVDSYYYVLLSIIIILMIVSDPHIGGFGRAVTFLLWGVVWTLVLITILWWIQSLLKHSSHFIFFSPDESGGLRERFSHAKTWYGVFVVFAFLILILAGIYVGAKIWHHPISLESFYILDIKLFDVRIDDKTLVSFTILSLVKIAGALCIGLIVSWAFAKFVLDRIFNLLFIDPGVQNTITRISNYFILFLALIGGLLNVGLGGQVPYFILAILLSVAWAVKGPVNDIIAYFIILVERSLKIGDFIEIDERITGVVRKISLRSVVLRRKNSVSIVVPNSHITSVPFYNWNYTRGYFAFNDILFTVSYQADPELVRHVLFGVLDANANVLKSPSPIIRLNEFGESGFVFLVRGFLSTVNVLNQWEICSTVRIEIVKALRSNGIIITPPVRIINIAEQDQNIVINSRQQVENDRDKTILE